LGERVTYRQVMAVPEFRALFLAELLSVAGDQIARIAVALLVYQRTHSALLASATYACSYLTWLLGGPFLSALADRHRRRRVMLVCDAGRAALISVLLLPHVPVGVVFGVLLGVAVMSPPFEGARSALLPEILGERAYTTGNALQNSVFTIGQVAGFAAGGALVAALGVRGALLLDALSFLASGLVVLGLVHERALPHETEQKESVWQQTAAGARLVVGEPALRWLLVLGTLGMVVVIPTEGLAVPTAARLGGGPVAAGILSAAAPAGYVVGAFLLTRLREEQRLRILHPLLLVTTLALLLTPVMGSVGAVTAVWTVAGAGSAFQVVANSQFVLATPPMFRARAFGVAATVIMGSQGLALLAAGALADAIDPRQVVALIALAAIVALPAVRGLSPKRARKTQGKHLSRRGHPG
jgi:MFS family permease